MSEPDLSTLPQRMRYAADAIDEFNKLLEDIYTTDCHWRPSELRREAGHLEAEEREAEERDALGLADAFLAEYNSDSLTEKMRIVSIARNLVKSGWRKADPA